MVQHDTRVTLWPLPALHPVHCRRPRAYVTCDMSKWLSIKRIQQACRESLWLTSLSLPQPTAFSVFAFGLL